MSQVLPSGCAFATAALPELPDAPVRFSITMVAPSRCAKPAWARRAMASTEPPGGNGTMILTGPDGQPCACAPRGATAAASTTRRLVNPDIKLPPHRFYVFAAARLLPAQSDRHSSARILATRRTPP